MRYPGKLGFYFEYKYLQCSLGNVRTTHRFSCVSIVEAKSCGSDSEVRRNGGKTLNSVLNTHFTQEILRRCVTFLYLLKHNVDRISNFLFRRCESYGVKTSAVGWRLSARQSATQMVHRKMKIFLDVLLLHTTPTPPSHTNNKQQKLEAIKLYITQQYHLLIYQVF